MKVRARASLQVSTQQIHLFVDGDRVAVLTKDEALRVASDIIELSAGPEALEGWRTIATAPPGESVLVTLKPDPGSDTGEIRFGYLTTLVDAPAAPHGIWTDDETGELLEVIAWMPKPLAARVSPQEKP
jgi:hypothetical protein